MVLATGRFAGSSPGRERDAQPFHRADSLRQPLNSNVRPQVNKHGLPPLVGGFKDGQVTWQRIESVNYDTLGYLLSCHLIIEHYMDHFLAVFPGARFGWEAARLTFNQKISLIGGVPFPEPYNLPPVIKHLNTVRNRFGHNINAALSADDLVPIQQFLAKCTKASGRTDELPTQPKDILGLFTSIVCAYFASNISYNAQFVKERTK